MSELRTQLERARGAHHAARYPGDLAADVLPPRASPWKVAAQGAVVVAAIAAVVLLAMRLSHLPDETMPEPFAQAPALETPGYALVFPALAMPEVPGEFASPEAPPLNVSPPSLSDMPITTDLEPVSREST